ncbi:MAG: GNAT family N-acetyltransferase [Actinomycetota bacterium]|nr:GNAT family N-acetyltransferase [Actinomycetota bacterium]
MVAALDLAGHAEEVLAIQRRAMGRLDERDAAYVAAHARRRGHRAFGAWSDGQLVGFAYGHDCGVDDWWTLQIGTVVPVELLVDAFSVVELHVSPEAQGRGTGRALLRRLLAGVPRRRVLLSAYDEPTPARRLYRSEGFRELAANFVFPTDAQPYVILAADLPLDSSRQT